MTSKVKKYKTRYLRQGTVAPKDIYIAFLCSSIKVKYWLELDDKRVFILNIDSCPILEIDLVTQKMHAKLFSELGMIIQYELLKQSSNEMYGDLAEALRLYTH